MKIHILGLPHTQTTEEFCTCAFTQKTLNLCKMLHRRGHEVIHYGVEGSNPECTEHVDVMSESQWLKEIGRPGTNYYNTKRDGELAAYHALFAKNMHEALASRVGDPYTEIVCQTWGGAQCTACEGIEQYLVESGIGYPESWAEWRVYESYAWMHMHLGRDRFFGGKKWYWAVIPNAFPVENFTPVEKRGEEFLYLGRLNDDKGVGIAIQVAKEVGRKIAIVGQGDPQQFLQGNPHARYLPPVGVAERRDLLANARAVFCLTQFVEPFCGVNVEAQLSGTPVITSDHGIFSESVLHGITGYRGRTFEQWVWAAKNIDRIDGRVCREWAEANYSLERVALMYEEYFQQLLNMRDWAGSTARQAELGRAGMTNTGFYERHPGRTQLDWLTRVYPKAAAEVTLDLSRPHEAPVVAAVEPTAPTAIPVDRTERYTEPEAAPPVVCIAVSCKGQAKYLAAAVRSLIAQTMTSWQAVLSCGDDESEAKARSLADLDPRVVVLPERTVLGLADARNKALAFGKPTPYCMSLDADDVLAPTYLEKMVAIARPKTIAACNLQEFGNRNRAMDLLVPAAEFRTRIPHANMIPYASVFPRALWEAVGGYDPTMFCIEDWDFWIALSRVGASLAHLPERLFLYRIHDEAMSLRHKSYEEFFRAKLVLRYVDPNNAGALRVIENVSPELGAKINAHPLPASIRPPVTEPDPHDRAFFDFMRTCRDPYRRLADAMHAVVGAHEAIDIGCGIGLQTLRLKELGWDIVGAEHAPMAIEMREPGIEIEPIDLTRTYETPRRFDCVICTETAEHIEAKHADAIVENVVKRATKTIVWSAAVPGQEWDGHVNLQPPSYWLTKFAVHGWEVDAQRTSDLRRIMLETNAQHWGCKDNFHVLVPMPAPLVSFVMRVHNEEKTLAASIASLLMIAIPIEIIVVLHRCTDRSKEIALAAPVPSRHRLRVVEYDVPVSRAGLETFITPEDSPHSLVSYYRYAFGLATSRWKVKWDGDFIATPSFVKWVNERDWNDAEPTIIHVPHRLLGSKSVVSREPYAHNCLRGFAKQNFWEVPVFDVPFAREDAPDEVAFIHASDLTDVKPYWQKEPWFLSAEGEEAQELRRRYSLAIQLVGPEPMGCARSRNHEAEAYLARCESVRDQIVAR